MAPLEAASLEWGEVGSEVTVADLPDGCGERGGSRGDPAPPASAQPLGAGCGQSGGEKPSRLRSRLPPARKFGEGNHIPKEGHHDSALVQG